MGRKEHWSAERSASRLPHDTVPTPRSVHHTVYHISRSSKAEASRQRQRNADYSAVPRCSLYVPRQYSCCVSSTYLGTQQQSMRACEDDRPRVLRSNVCNSMCGDRSRSTICAADAVQKWLRNTLASSEAMVKGRYLREVSRSILSCCVAHDSNARRVDVLTSVVNATYRSME